MLETHGNHPLVTVDFMEKPPHLATPLGDIISINLTSIPSSLCLNRLYTLVHSGIALYKYNLFRFVCFGNLIAFFHYINNLPILVSVRYGYF